MNEHVMADEQTAAAPPAAGPVLYLNAVQRRYQQGEAELMILRGAELGCWLGQSIALIAPSGAGKSTLLHIAGLLEHPDGGEVFVDGKPTSGLSDADRTAIRRVEMGFVYQAHHLLPEFSAVENVMLPQMIRGLSRAEARKRASELLSYLGLKARLEHRPAELSGGEQQRVALARALAPNPSILVADEPTGNLDDKTGQQVIELLFRGHVDRGMTLILVTHDNSLARRCARTVRMRSGRIEEESLREAERV